jgi:hypothetical protein
MPWIVESNLCVHPTQKPLLVATEGLTYKQAMHKHVDAVLAAIDKLTDAEAAHVKASIIDTSAWIKDK